VRWNLSVVLICISFIAKAIKAHFFMCLFAIWNYFFEKVLFSSVAHFLIGSLILGEFHFLSSVYILVISPLSDVLSSHFHILSHSTVHTTSWTWKTQFHPLIVLIGCPIERWSSSPSASWGRSELEPGFLPIWWVVDPSLLVPELHCVPLCIQGPHTELHGRWIPPQIKLFIGAFWDLLLKFREDVPQWQGRWQLTIFTILDNEPPRNVAGVC
jgi:hypothetical protein